MKNTFKIISIFVLSNLLSLQFAFITQAYAVPSNITDYTIVGPNDECPSNQTKFAQLNQHPSTMSVHIAEGVNRSTAGLNICADLGNEAADFDNDGITNLSDRCPADFTPDKDGDDRNGTQVDSDIYKDEDFDGLYDNFCDEYDHLNTLLASQAEAECPSNDENRGNCVTFEERSEEGYFQTTGGLTNCLATSSNSHPICNVQNIEEESYQNPSYENLIKALQNEQIIQVLDEPISTENLFQKARVCSTKFLKDANGLLQPVDRSNLYQTYEESEINNIFASTEFIITNDKCEEFFVENCQPSPNIKDSITIAESADGLPTRVYCSEVQVLFADSGTDLLKVYVNLIYKWATGIIGVIAVIVIIINGILISASNGDSGKVDAAKARILQSIMGLALLFLSGILLYSINPNFFRPTDQGKTPSSEYTEETDKPPTESETE